MAEKAVKQKEKQLETARNRRAAGRRHRPRGAALRGRPRERARAAPAPGRGGRARPRPAERGDGAAHRRAHRAHRPPRVRRRRRLARGGGGRRPGRPAGGRRQVDLERADPRRRGRHRARPTCGRSLDFNGSLRLVRRARPSNFFESDFQRWNAGVSLTSPGVRRLAHRGQGRPGPGRARTRSRRTASPSRTRSASKRKDAVDRLRVAESVLQRGRAERAAGPEGPRDDPGQLPARRGHPARRARRPGRPHPGREQPHPGALRPRQRPRHAALRDGRDPLDPPAARPSTDAPTSPNDAGHDHDDTTKPFLAGPALAALASRRLRRPRADRRGRQATRRARAHGRRSRRATSTRRWCSPAPCGRGPRCRSWPRSRRASCASLRDEGARVGRGRDPGRPRRHRLPPRPRPRARPRWPWPRPTGPRRGREGARRQPAEDRRHHRQGPPGGAGGPAGGRGASWPRSRAEVAIAAPAARAHRRSRRPSPAAWPSAWPTRARCSPPARRSSPSWTTPCSSSAPPCPPATTARSAWARRSRVTVDALPGRTVKGRVARIAPLVDERTPLVRGRRRGARATPSSWAACSRARRCSVGHGAGRARGAAGGARARRRDRREAQTFVVDGRQGRAARRDARRRERRTRSRSRAASRRATSVVLDPPVALASGAPVELQAARQVRT